jgi:hypothetical protein
MPPMLTARPSVLADLALYFRSIALDIRQDQIAQREDQPDEGEIETHQSTQHDPSHRTYCRVRRLLAADTMQAMVQSRAQLILAHQLRPPRRDFCQQSVRVTRMSEEPDQTIQ